MKTETLEEAAEKFATDCTLISDSAAFEGFIEGAKWQQERSYSKEEVIQLLIKFNQEIQEVEGVRECFEQFKKK